MSERLAEEHWEWLGKLLEYNYKTALVIGNEANGINDELVSKSDVLVKIPIYGKAESLNAAISSAILMYEIKKYLV